MKIIFPSWHPVFGSHYSIGVSAWNNYLPKKKRTIKKEKSLLTEFLKGEKNEKISFCKNV
jgi:hypothetical protein